MTHDDDTQPHRYSKYIGWILTAIGFGGIFWWSTHMGNLRQEAYKQRQEQKMQYMQLCMSQAGSATECQSRWSLRLQPTGWN